MADAILPEIQVQKRCRRCDAVKPAHEFYRCATGKNGLSTYCRPCSLQNGRENQQKRRAENTSGDKAFVLTRKKCSSCKETKPAEAFRSNHAVKGGLSNKCKDCATKYDAERRARNKADREAGKKVHVPISEKACARCDVVKPASQFHKTAADKHGLHALCKPCANALAAEYRVKNADRDFPVSVEQKKCSKCQKIKPAIEFYRYRKSRDGLVSCCKVCCDEMQTKRAAKRREAGKTRKPAKWKHADDIYLSPDISKKCTKCGEVKPLNQFHKSRYAKDGAQSQCGACTCKIQSEKIKTDAKFRLNCFMTTGISQTLKGNKNHRSWRTMVPYTVQELEAHLRKTLKAIPGYTWEDFMAGRLHLEHKIPKSAFNFSSPEDIDFQRCWGLGNLRLLPAAENLAKNARLDKPFQPSLAGL